MLVNETPLSFGGVQGSRPAVGPDGEVYGVWQELGFVDADTMKVRVSHEVGE